MNKAPFFALIACLSIAAMTAFAGPRHKKMSRRALERAPRFLFINKDSEIISLGNITDLEYDTFAFEFINVGKTPLVITKATGECGCTIPQVSNVPIPPGGKGRMGVMFNPTAKAGPFRKAIFIESNALPNGADGNYTVYIEGAVVPGLPIYHPPPRK